MGLDFYIGTGGIDNLGEHLGSLSDKDHHWLYKNKMLVSNKNGYKEEGVGHSIPFYDDAILTADQVKLVKEEFDCRKLELMQTPGFTSTALDKFEHILLKAIDLNVGMSTLVD